MFFSTNTFLTVSGQLHAEAIMRYIKNKKIFFFLDSLIAVYVLYLVE